MKQDSLDIEVMDDGTIKVTTPKVSAANHLNAEQLLAFMSRLAGGDPVITKRKATHTHVTVDDTVKAS